MMCVQANSAETLARQNCVSILLHRQAAQSTARYTAASGRGGHGFKCKSCDRAFETFQALGGHRASHKKLRLTGDAITRTQGGGLVAPAVQSNFHECRECRIRFPTGQALGGHMRKHVDSKAKRKRVEEDDHDSIMKKQIRTLPILSESKTSKRVVLNLDLNFPPPLEEYSFLQLV